MRSWLTREGEPGPVAIRGRGPSASNSVGSHLVEPNAGAVVRRAVEMGVFEVRSSNGTSKENSVKKLSAITTSALLGLGLLVGATEATADPSVQVTNPQNQTATLGDMVGSDTLEDISKAVLAAAPSITTDAAGTNGRGIANYSGLGSSGGQRQLIGNPGTGEPTCGAGTAVNGDTNWGCQEVAPMSRQLNNAVCGHDADDPRDGDDSTTVNSTAEGLAVCLDGLSIVTDNASHRQFADNAGSCVAPSGEPVWGPSSDNAAGIPGINGYAATGKLRTGGPLVGDPSYVLGAVATVPGWKDVLRLIYTGCKQGDGLCANTITRATRCGATSNPTRAALVNNYGNVFEGVDCPEGDHCTQLRAAYRRDDASGTTSFFLDVLGLRSGTNDLAARTRAANVGGSGTAGFQNVPENIFCDGGQFEGLWPAPYATGTVPVVAAVAAGQAFIGDPLQRPCAAEDDLCGPTGTTGLVRPIRSPREFGFPSVQCTRNNFDRKPWPNTGTVPTCADGTAPTLRGCYAPYFSSSGTQNFDCLNPSNSRPLQSPGSLDGRVFNFVWRLSNGDLSNANHEAANAAALPEIAQWRQNAATLNTGAVAAAGGVFGSTAALRTQSYTASGTQAAFTKVFTGGQVCQQGSATSLIGCIVGNTRCTIGVAGREAADRAPDDDNQEVIRLPGADGNSSVPSDTEIITDNYPISRSLFLNAIGGFENIQEDCAARSPTDGTRSEYCDDQAEFTRRFYAMNADVRTACEVNGFIPVVPDAAPPACAGDADCNSDMAKRWTARCVGAASGETGTIAAGCGRVNTATTTLSSGKVLPYQPASRCDPDAAVSPEDSGTNSCVDYSVSSGAGPTCG